jgi:hypothetical protein
MFLALEYIETIFPLDILIGILFLKTVLCTVELFITDFHPFELYKFCGKYFLSSKC